MAADVRIAARRRASASPRSSSASSPASAAPSGCRGWSALAKALEMNLTGEPIDADEAWEHGLVTPRRARPRAARHRARLGAPLAAQAPLAVEQIKRAANGSEPRSPASRREQAASRGPRLRRRARGHRRVPREAAQPALRRPLSRGRGRAHARTLRPVAEPDDSAGARREPARPPRGARRGGARQARAGPAREPVGQLGADRGARGARPRRAGAGGRDGVPQPAVGRADRAADAPRALALAAARVDRGRARAARGRAARGPGALAARLDAIEQRLAELDRAARRAARRGRGPATVSRDQERLRVEDAGSRRRRRAGARPGGRTVGGEDRLRAGARAAPRGAPARAR